MIRADFHARTGESRRPGGLSRRLPAYRARRNRPFVAPVITPAVAHRANRASCVVRLLLPQRDELLGRGWMDADRLVELRLRRARPDRDRDALDDLRRVAPDHVRADDALAVARDDELHERLFVAAGQRVPQRAERRLVDVERAELGARLRLGEPDRRDLRLAEHRGRNVAMIGGDPLAAEQVRREQHAVARRDGRQLRARGDVADRVDRRHRRRRIGVDFDRAVRVARDPDRLEPEPVAIRDAPRRIQHRVVRPVRALGEPERQPAVGAALDRLDRRARMDGDTLLRHLAMQRVPHVVVEAAQDLLAAIEQVDIDAEPVEDARELDRDVAAADDRDPLRQLGQLERLARRDRVLDAGNRRQHRPRACRDGDVPGGDTPARDVDRMRADERRAPRMDLDARLVQQIDVDTAQARDLAVLRLDERRPRKQADVEGPAIARGVLDIVAVMRRVDEQLFRDAAAQHAGAADALFLGDADARAVGRRDAAQAHAARARADDKEIVVEFHSVV
ncbi:hypothetical protein BURPS1710b_0499 [Burkholderia pseudomallei 1710b]|uniref:Uncharacterized protein n=1 Tax=Burkholderia pseudomallei (strain 1710b) TaxID=320372 RepID=Q3JWZ1_BURP1|nr:hypothetical protein BURPS1710b_0499 [Burkholderia pseudomallei 1710b]